MRFTFTCTPDPETCIETVFGAEHIEAVVGRFKEFLLHCGYHLDNIERITFEENRQGLPQQLELFPEDNS